MRHLLKRKPCKARLLHASKDLIKMGDILIGKQNQYVDIEEASIFPDSSISIMSLIFVSVMEVS